MCFLFKGTMFHPKHGHIGVYLHFPISTMHFMFITVCLICIISGSYTVSLDTSG